MNHMYTYGIRYLDYHWSRSDIHMDLFIHVNDEQLAWLVHFNDPHVFKGYNGWYYPTSNNWEHMHVLIQLLESCGLTPLADGEWLHYSEDARFQYLVNQPQAAIKAASQHLLVAMTTSTIVPFIGPSMALLASISYKEFQVQHSSHKSASSSGQSSPDAS